ncbi:MAG: hypothetical protein WEB03_09170 [Nitriliruptor sp.]|uniref:ArsR family transcriptional regulator n=1 Tax=Nitriliruptor sp. TaxID=2448056 RepID=UPI0034A0363F
MEDVMGAMAPALAPIFRSDTQMRLLGELACAPAGQELDISELARRTAAQYATVHREVERLLMLGILTEARVGRSRTIAWSDQPPYAAPLRQLLMQTYGPLPALRDVLADQPWIDQVFVFGSWAQRFTGEPGPPPNDIDVMVVFDPDHPDFPEEDTLAIFQLVSRAGGRVPGAAFNATPVEREEWAQRSTAFLRGVSDGPRVGVHGDDYGRVS